MPVADLLHINRLDEFVAWLDANQIPHRPGKGEYQVMQVKTTHAGWQVVYRRKEMPENFSLNNRLAGLVRKFIRETAK